MRTALIIFCIIGLAASAIVGLSSPTGKLWRCMIISASMCLGTLAVLYAPVIRFILNIQESENGQLVGYYDQASNSMISVIEPRLGAAAL